MKNIIYILSAITLFCSCEKVVEVDLNETEAKLVIEAIVQEGNSFVNLSRTNTFAESGTDTQVSNASVQVQDLDGEIYLFEETTPGIYTAPSLIPLEGMTYNLTVIVDGNSILASSTMPLSVALDTLRFKEENEPFNDTTFYELEPYFTDPGGVDNYYQMVVMKNGKQLSGFNTINDNFFDGLTTRYPGFREEFLSGDTVRVDLYSISQEAYDYLVVLEDNTQDTGIFSGAPSDPNPFFSSGDVLGYFSVQSGSTLTEVAPE